MRKRRHFAVLGQFQLNRTGDLLHGFHLGGGAHTANAQTDVYGRADAFVEQFCFQENLAIGDRNYISRNVGGHVSSLGFDDR